MFNYTWQAEQRGAAPQRGSKTTAELLSVGRANNNQPPPKPPNILSVQTAGREEVRGGGGLFSCVCV